jgi:hypothetical protein
MHPGEPPSPRNKIMEDASVIIAVLPRAQAALEALRFRWLSGNGPQIPPREGSYSGRKIGDRCLRGGTDSDTSAGLGFIRGTVYYEITLTGPSGALDYHAAIERLALALVERADAAKALAFSSDTSVTVANRALTGKTPNGISVVHVQNYANATGAAVKVDFPGGTLEVTRNGHTLKVNIGRKEAWFDGQPFTLPFPVMRHGKDQVYCPLDALMRLGN